MMKRDDEDVRVCLRKVKNLKLWMRGLTFITIIVLLVLIAIKTELFEIIISGDVQEITEFLGDNILYSLFMTSMVMFVHNAIPVIPLILVITLNNTIFGYTYGFVWSILTSIISAVVVFYSSRKGMQDWVIKRVNPTMLIKLEQKGFWFVIYTRILPIAPTSMINIVSGISHIRFSAFFIATVAGNLVLFAIYTLIQAGLLSSGANKYVIGIGMILAAIIIYLVKKIAKLRKNNKLKKSVNL